MNLACVSLPGYNWQCGLKYTGINLQTLQDKNLIFTLENKIRGGVSSVMGDGNVKSDESKKILYIDASNLYGHSMSQVLPCDEIEMWHGHPDLYMKKLEENLLTPDDSDIGSFIEVDLKYPYNIKEKTKNFQFYSENKIIPEDQYNDYMKKLKPKNYRKTKKLICDWTDEKNSLILYTMFIFHVRHGMIIDKYRETNSFRQSKWLDKYINFITQKLIKAKNEFENDFYKLFKNALYGRTTENVRNRLRLEFIKNYEYKKPIKQLSKLAYAGIHKSCVYCDSSSFKQNEVKMNKPIYSGFSVLELSKSHV